VLPGKPEDKHRFAVCWNGLVYPAVSVGEKADLKTDVAAAVKAAKEDRDSDEAASPASEEGWSLWYRRLGGYSEIALLLRSGEGDLATKLWEAHHAPRKGEDAPAADGERDPYPLLASAWAWRLFDRGLCAHMRGDDKLALHDFRLLNAVAGPIEAEAKKRGYTPDKKRDEERLLDFLGQLPDLLADQKRRAKEGPHPPVVCVGPGREPDPARRIAALIERLDEVSARQWGQPGGVNLSDDPVVAALIREGDPAIEPLLRCFETDARLTRSVHFWRDFSQSRTALAVHEAAYVALGALLQETDFRPRATGDNLTRGGEEPRKRLAEQVRRHLKTH
jgi:hypothetical protein